MIQRTPFYLFCLLLVEYVICMSGKFLFANRCLFIINYCFNCQIGIYRPNSSCFRYLFSISLYLLMKISRILFIYLTNKFDVKIHNI